MSLMKRRTMMTTSVAPGIDVIAGTATVVGTTLTMPIPAGYYCHCYLSELAANHTLAENDLRVWYRDQYGFFRIKSASGGAEKISTDPFVSAFYVNQTATQVTLDCSNGNTSGLLVDGDTWTYVAWKEN